MFEFAYGMATIGDMNNDMHRIAIGIGDTMALEALYLFIRIIALYAVWRDHDDLAVDISSLGAAPPSCASYPARGND